MPSRLPSRLRLAVAGACAVLASSPALADTITATSVAAAIKPATVPGTQDLLNGDFKILANPLAGATGDGWDEWTIWSFDFSSDPGYAGFIAGGSLTSARLTLHLNVGGFSAAGTGPVTDITYPSFAGLGVFPVWGIPEFIPASPLGGYVPGSITTDLVADVGQDPAQLFNWLKDHDGKFPMIYGDDAILTAASLQLTAAVPEPETYAMMLAGLGLLGYVARRRRGRG